ncbi:MAG TPA: hypothetical protein ENK23_06400 [Sorangium sp.]|nr:hypothetical protein [Sorangium sp.]
MTARDNNDEVRAVLRRMDTANELLSLRRAQRQALEKRYSRPAPPLGSFIESAARANGLEVPEATDRSPVERKGYSERSTVVKLRKIGLRPLVKMLEKIERSRHPLSVTKLTIKKRPTPPDNYDVELVVTAYDKASAKAGDKDKKDKKGGKTKAGSTKGQRL